MQRFPGDVLQAAAGRAQIALAMAGADYAVVYLPATVGQAPSVLLCDKRGALAQAIGPDTPDAAIANHLLDLVRRRVLGLRLSRRPSPSAPGTSARCSSSRRTANPRRAARGAFRCAAARPARRNPCGNPRRNRP